MIYIIGMIHNLLNLYRLAQQEDKKWTQFLFIKNVPLRKSVVVS